MTFDIVLSAYLGVDPIAEVVKLWNYERGGIAVPLVIGNKGYYRRCHQQETVLLHRG